jgi:hypothetical protein
MTGPEHYKEAQRLAEQVRDARVVGETQKQRLAEAQVHATLALAAATIDAGYAALNFYNAAWHEATEA